MKKQKCERKYITCDGLAVGIINRKLVCNGCREKGEEFDSKIK